MQPSDPDFPYDIEALECVLNVPLNFPSEKPTLVVGNKDIPRGFQINIERGFDTIVNGAQDATLLGLMNRLDKALEKILSGQIADTIKIVANQSQGTKPPQGSKPVSQPREPAEEPLVASKAATSEQQRAEAQKKRQSDVRQLEARFGRLQHFAKSADGSRYTVPIDSPKRSTWPTTLQSLKSAQVVVPDLYPLQPAELQLSSETTEARAVEAAFKARCTENPSATITQHINYLSQHLKDMSVVAPKPQVKEAAPTSNHTQETSPSKAIVSSHAPKTDENDRTHLHCIQRPPEWDPTPHSDDSSGDESDEFGSDTDHNLDTEEDDTNHPENEPASVAPAERGILISFPQLELYGIELLELTLLNITIKCERCKDTMDIERLRSVAESSAMHEASCKKCASALAARFRADLIHANSVRAGYLDLDGCTVVDMLPR